eukprot:COSAG06_NODE_8361_length_2194_cov_2283.744986_1_plen_373_part_00
MQPPAATLQFQTHLLTTMEQWQFDDSPRGWKPYGVVEQQALAAARAAGQRSVALVTGRWSYTVDLVARTQTNTQTGTVRPVRAVPNDPMPADEPEVDDDLAAAIAASLAEASFGDAQLSMAAGGAGGGAARGARAGGGAELGSRAPDTAEVGVPPRDVVATAAGETPRWLRYSGPRRIMAEFKSVCDALEKEPGSLGALRSIEMVDDDCAVWRLQVAGFDDDLPGARALNGDLAELQRQAGGSAGAITMEATFPPSYPAAPFFLRVISPRMQMYTGHVTAGGSICVEALTNTGTPNSWQRDFTFEGVLQTVLHNMVDVEAMDVRTATGPGGRSGPLRVDLQHGAAHCMREYSNQEAQAAFGRTLAHHAANGW